MKTIKIENEPKIKTGFTVPENYFEDFSAKMRQQLPEKEPKVISKILDIINTTTEEFKDIPSIDRTLATRFHQKTEDIQEWLSLTEWSQKKLTKKTFDTVQNQLFELKIIENKISYEAVVK